MQYIRTGINGIWTETARQAAASEWSAGLLERMALAAENQVLATNNMANAIWATIR